MKQSRKTVETRQQNILNMVRLHGEIKVEDIAGEYGISTMTVRRDLQHLEQKQLLQRTHGGAISLEKSRSLNFSDSNASIYRDRISAYSASLLSDGDTVFINGSRTALDMLKYVNGISINVFTNNGWAIGEQYPEGVSIHFLGGDMRGRIMVGDYVMKNLLEMSADKTFIGCAAVYDDGEFRYDIPTEIGINEAMISRTRQSFYVLADHTKFHSSEERENLYGSSIFEPPVNLITDDRADGEIIERLRAFGINVIVVPVHGASKGDL